MICPKCQAEVNDNLMFCSNCGEKLNDALPVAIQSGNKRKFKWIPLIALLLIPLLLLTIFSGFSIHSSPEQVARAFVTAELNADVKGILECLPDALISRLNEHYDLSESASTGKLAKRLDDEIPRGDVRQVYDEYDIVSVEVTRELTLGKYYDKYDYYEFIRGSDYDEDCEVAVVNVCIEVGGDETEVRLFCMKSNFKWYVFSIDQYNIDLGFYFRNYRAISYY